MDVFQSRNSNKKQKIWIRWKGATHTRIFYRLVHMEWWKNLIFKVFCFSNLIFSPFTSLFHFRFHSLCLPVCVSLFSSLHLSTFDDQKREKNEKKNKKSFQWEIFHMKIFKKKLKWSIRFIFEANEPSGEKKRTKWKKKGSKMKKKKLYITDDWPNDIVWESLICYWPHELECIFVYSIKRKIEKKNSFCHILSKTNWFLWQWWLSLRLHCFHFGYMFFLRFSLKKCFCFCFVIWMTVHVSPNDIENCVCVFFFSYIHWTLCDRHICPKCLFHLETTCEFFNRFIFGATIFADGSHCGHVRLLNWQQQQKPSKKKNIFEKNSSQ